MLFRMMAAFVAWGFVAATSFASVAADHVVTIMDQKAYPESVTSTAAGDLIIGSMEKGAIYRAKAGSDKATLWLDPAKTGLISVLGVFADNASNTLYVCSLAPYDAPPSPEKAKYAVLRAFDLTSGADKQRYPMIDPDKAVCNDVDVAKDGTVYVTDTGNSQLLRLKKGATALEIWAKDEKLTTVDGLALGKGVLYVNSVTTNRLFAVPITADGSAGQIKELHPSQPLAGPDGMRSLGGNKFLLAENSQTIGRISEVTVNGDKAELSVLKDDPGVTAMTKIGNLVWIDNAKFTYRNGSLKGQSPEPFVIYAVPLK